MLLPIAAAAAIACLSNPAAILEAKRKATEHSKPISETIISRYRVSGQGLMGDAIAIVDTVSGAYVETSETPPIVGGEGFDGREAWARDISGHASPQGGGNKRELAVNRAYRNANAWWSAGHDGARIEELGCDRLRVTPRSGTPFEAAFDPQTHLLRSVREAATFGQTTEIRFADYVPKGGRMMPSRTDIIANGDPDSSITLKLIAARVEKRRPAASYATPSEQPRDWALPATGRVTLPFRLLNNHVIVDVKIDGHGPLPFLVDTGGHDILTPWAAAAMGLRSKGASSSSGAGDHSVTSGYTRVGRIDAGGAMLHDQPMIVLDFSPPDVEGIRLGGMLGQEFIERFVVQFDYGAKTLTMIDPARFSGSERQAAGTPVPFRFYDHMPQVEGSIDGLPARFNIDTGSRSDVTLTRPFVEREGLRARYPAGVVVTDGWGVGGPSKALVARAGSLKMGEVEVPGPLAGLSAAKAGAFSDANYEGNVGSGLLKRFVVTFDYGRRTMYLSPLAQPDPYTSLADRSGMWINLGANGLDVMDVTDGGPAESAGLRKSDVIHAIDGVPVSRRTLSDWRSHLKQVLPGRSIVVGFSRAGTEHKAAIVARDLVPAN